MSLRKKIRSVATAAITISLLSTATLFAADPIIVDVMPMVGDSGWSDVVDGAAPTSVTYDTAATTDSTMKVTLIRKAMANADDWQSAFSSATVMNGDAAYTFDKVENVIITYKVAAATDTVAFFLTDGVSVEGDKHGGFRAVLEAGATNPGNFVTDTLDIASFTMNWADAGSGFVNDQVLADSTIAVLKGVAFGSEREQNNGIPGDTLVLEVSALKFEVSSSSAIKIANLSTNNLKSGISAITLSKMNIQVPTTDNYKVSIYTVNGREVQSFKTKLSAGKNNISWNGTALTSNVYVVRISGKDFKVSQKINVQ